MISSQRFRGRLVKLEKSYRVELYTFARATLHAERADEVANSIGILQINVVSFSISMPSCSELALINVAFDWQPVIGVARREGRLPESRPPETAANKHKDNPKRTFEQSSFEIWFSKLVRVRAIT